ncbi:glycosyltransferase family 4 protein [Emticicia sp. SJ17W-69]|uniref:glycosyltransferase family 4 protein n=1 Tax=Emticicia sp. SJ17W-69 TaxID=3421657 RepID=UPI003EB72E98
MKIFVDAHKFDHSFQGTSTYIKGLYNALVKYDDVEITLCANDIDNLKENFKDKRFKFIKSEAKSKIKRLGIEYPLILKRGKYDFAHFQYIVPPIKFCKYINTIHDLLFLEFKDYFPWQYRLINGTLFRISAFMSEIVLTVSAYSKKSVNQIYKIPLEKIFITNNAVQSIPSEKVDIQKKYGLTNYILYVSRFEPRKNHLLLLKAYLESNLFSKGYELVFIGTKKEPIEIDAYNNLIKNIPLNIKEKVKFYESLNVNELNNFYNQASCFVFPSVAEGFGIPPLEAAINNCKVLCSNATAMADFDFFKYRFNPDDFEDFKNQLNRILEDKDYPYDNIRNKIQLKYNWDRIAFEFYQVLKEKLCK